MLTTKGFQPFVSIFCLILMTSSLDFWQPVFYLIKCSDDFFLFSTITLIKVFSFSYLLLLFTCSNLGAHIGFRIRIRTPITGPFFFFLKNRLGKSLPILFLNLIRINEIMRSGPGSNWFKKRIRIRSIVSNRLMLKGLFTNFSKLHSRFLWLRRCLQFSYHVKWRSIKDVLPILMCVFHTLQMIIWDKMQNHSFDELTSRS